MKTYFDHNTAVAVLMLNWHTNGKETFKTVMDAVSVNNNESKSYVLKN